MIPRRWIGLALGWSMSLVQPLLGQDLGCQRRIFPVSVTDREGSPVRDLTPADFRAELRGQAVKILSVLPDNRPHRIVILLDASGSMRGQTGRRWVTTVAAVQELVQSDTENSFLCIVDLWRQSG